MRVVDRPTVDFFGARPRETGPFLRLRDLMRVKKNKKINKHIISCRYTRGSRYLWFSIEKKVLPPDDQNDFSGEPTEKKKN